MLADQDAAHGKAHTAVMGAGESGHKGLES